jgi:uncharacterized protein YecE (DUF72 family)
MENKILVGTSGWGYDEWVGPFYPKTLKREDFLLYYSEIFYTNEINTTFYNVPSKWVVKSWVDKTPDNFLFTVKVPKKITHEYKLDSDHCLNDLNYFMTSIDPLIKAKKLLSFLIQLPPSFNKKEHFGVLRDFIRNWPLEVKGEDYYIAIEFRNESWMDEKIFDYLKKNSLTYCAVIEPLLPPRLDITNPEFFYMRFHGYGKEIWFDYCFSEEEIKRWAISVNKIINKVDKVGIYFNNHFSGYAAKNSLMMMRELKLEPKKLPNEVSILEIKKKSGAVSRGQTDLDKFIK